MKLPSINSTPKKNSFKPADDWEMATFMTMTGEPYTDSEKDRHNLSLMRLDLPTIDSAMWNSFNGNPPMLPENWSGISTEDIARLRFELSAGGDPLPQFLKVLEPELAATKRQLVEVDRELSGRHTVPLREPEQGVDMEGVQLPEPEPEQVVDSEGAPLREPEQVVDSEGAPLREPDEIADMPLEQSNDGVTPPPLTGVEKERFDACMADSQDVLANMYISQKRDIAACKLAMETGAKIPKSFPSDSPATHTDEEKGVYNYLMGLTKEKTALASVALDAEHKAVLKAYYASQQGTQQKQASQEPQPYTELEEKMIDALIAKNDQDAIARSCAAQERLLRAIQNAQAKGLELPDKNRVFSGQMTREDTHADMAAYSLIMRLPTLEAAAHAHINIARKVVAATKEHQNNLQSRKSPQPLLLEEVMAHPQKQIVENCFVIGRRINEIQAATDQGLPMPEPQQGGFNLTPEEIKRYQELMALDQRSLATTYLDLQNQLIAASDKHTQGATEVAAEKQEVEPEPEISDLHSKLSKMSKDELVEQHVDLLKRVARIEAAQQNISENINNPESSFFGNAWKTLRSIFSSPENPGFKSLAFGSFCLGISAAATMATCGAAPLVAIGVGMAVAAVTPKIAVSMTKPIDTLPDARRTNFQQPNTPAVVARKNALRGNAP